MKKKGKKKTKLFIVGLKKDPNTHWIQEGFDEADAVRRAVQEGERFMDDVVFWVAEIPKLPCYSIKTTLEVVE